MDVNRGPSVSGVRVTNVILLPQKVEVDFYQDNEGLQFPERSNVLCKLAVPSDTPRLRPTTKKLCCTPFPSWNEHAYINLFRF